MLRSRFLPLFVLFVSLVVGACALEQRYTDDRYAENPARPSAGEIEHRVILIGDAGYAEPDDRVIKELTRVVDASAGIDVTVIFLGDNIYPHGLPAASDPAHEIALRRLEAQMDATLAGGSTAVFIPGNHDYDAGGTAAVERQANHIATYSGGRAEMLPRGSCPGPIVRDVKDHLRIVYVDTVWLVEGEHLHPCRGRDPGGEPDPAMDVYDALSEAIASRGERLVLIAAHHPLASHGIHGGFVPWQQHLFPLWNINALKGTPWPYFVPVPVIPTLIYAIPRSQGVYTRDDLENWRYRAMRKAFEQVLRRHPTAPIIMAGGHEHSQQLLRLEELGLPDAIQIVSGAGTAHNLTSVGVGSDTVVATPVPGFFVVDVVKDTVSDPRHRALIEMVEVAKKNADNEKTLSSEHIDGNFRLWFPLQAR
jgi:hypothetical protein